MKRHIVPDIVDQQELWTITPQTTVREAAKLMAQRRIGAAMVLSEGRLVGVCGLNVDPYLDDPSVGRVRHLYVLVAARR